MTGYPLYVILKHGKKEYNSKPNVGLFNCLQQYEGQENMSFGCEAYHVAKPREKISFSEEYKISYDVGISI